MKIAPNEALSFRQNQDFVQKKKKLEEAATQFESIFINQIFKEALPEGKDGDSVLFGQSNAMDIYKSMLYDALSEEMAASGGIGIKDKLLEQYKELYNGLDAKPEIGTILNENFEISSGFGFRNDPISGEKAFHYGVDLAAPLGAGVNSPVAGTVHFAGEKPGYGKIVEIMGNNGNLYKFGHLNSFDLKEGDKIIKNQKIGEVGSSGKSTGPHLHFEIRDNKGTALNPAALFSMKKMDDKVKNIALRRQL